MTASNDASQQPSTPAPPPSGVAADALVVQALVDLAGRLGVDPADVALASIQQVTWPDGSLGCPQEGMLYPQVLTQGSRIVLESGGKRYAYHSGGGRGPFLCENPEPPTPVRG